MKTWKLLLVLHLATFHLSTAHADDLENAIEDELDSSTADTEDMQIDEGDENLDEEFADANGESDTEGEQQSSSQDPKAKKAAKPAETSSAPDVSDEVSAESSDGDVATEEETGGDDLDFEDEDVAAEPEPTDEMTVESDDASDPELDSELEAEPEENVAAEPAPEPEPEPAVEPETNIYKETLSGFDDHINTAFEKRLYRIFQQGRGVPSEQYDAIIGAHASELYRVGRGDTLWDISAMFFGDGSFWPRLWSENARLTNPHEIRVGKGVAFVAGTEEDAPYVTVTDVRIDKAIRPQQTDPDTDPSAPVYPDDPEAQLTGEEVAAGTVLEEQSIVGGRPDIPESLTPSSSTLKRLPNSFVMPVPPLIEGRYDGTGLDAGRRKAVDVPAVVYLTSYISDHSIPSVGVISEVEAQEKTAGNLQNVLITGKRSLAVGERFTAVMDRGSVSTRKSKSFGPVLDVGGLIEIVDVIDEGKRLYRGTVARSVNPVEIGAALVEDPMPKASYSVQAPHSDIQARIVGGEFDANRRVLGPGSVVYLDEGSKAGLAEGQMLAVRTTRGERREGTAFPNVGQAIAIIKIARVYESVATAMIVSAYGDVRPGDLTGGPFPRAPRPLKSRAQSSDATEVTAQVEDGFGDEDLDEADDLGDETEL